MSKLTLAEAISAFGAAGKAKLSNSAATGQPEDQLRSPLEELFSAFAELTGKSGMVTLVGETSLAGAQTRPDFAVTVGAGKAKALIGFIEVKAPGKGADPRKFKDAHDKGQWTKLKALPNLLYTDGEAFSLWRDGEAAGIVRLDGDIATSGNKLSAPDQLLPLIEDFLTWQPMPPRNAHQLAVTAARLCRFLRNEVLEQMEPKESALRDLAKDWRGLLFPEASDEQFADGYAQAVTFGLLMAKSEKIDLDEGLADVASDLAKSSTLIGRAFDLLTKQENLLGPSLKTLVRVLNVVDWDVIAKGNPEAWIDFYELFLSVYDNKLRKLTGSYYTPPEVVRAMVRLCDEALKSRFNKPAGLADAEVQIADPAVGSGTFLLGLLRHMADWKEADEGEGAVGPFITEAAKRLYGFELQFGPFAVAQLRLHAEMIGLKAKGSPHLYVTDTLGDPNQAFERGTGIYAALSKSQEEANEVKRTQPITVVIGNPPYKEKAKGKGSWVENGTGNSPAPLKDWQPPKKWKVGAHAKHLRNLYIYFWRWAAWKVFEQGSGGRDKEPPVEEKLFGVVCYITASGFLNGPGFEKMRHDLRHECDEIWVIDCSPEGQFAKVNTRIFQGVKHRVCIVIACRSPTTTTDIPARVRFRALATGSRSDKFLELNALTLASKGWTDCPTDWRAPFLPVYGAAWAEFVPLERIISDSGAGVMPGRTWAISPDKSSLEKRWARLRNEKDEETKEKLFHPQLRKGKVAARHIRKIVKQDLGRFATRSIPILTDAGGLMNPVPYGFRSFDRQWLPPDNRLLNDPRPTLWPIATDKQVFLTALSATSPKAGPAVTLTGLIPDQDHFSGKGGRVFALWEDAEAVKGNITYEAIKALTKQHGAAPNPEDVFAYVAALLANPAYTDKFKSDLVRPGLRVPLTADKKLFAKAAEIGRQVIWLHTFGERFADPAQHRPAGQPKLPDAERPKVLASRPIPDTPQGFPDTIDYDPAKQELKIGTGVIAPVAPEVWAYEVSGKQVLRQWFSYRRKNREKPQIGDRRPPSPLGEIQPDHWLPEYTTELLNVINVLGLLVKLEPKQKALLDEIVDGPLIPAAKFAS